MVLYFTQYTTLVFISASDERRVDEYSRTQCQSEDEM